MIHHLYGFRCPDFEIEGNACLKYIFLTKCDKIEKISVISR